MLLIDQTLSSEARQRTASVPRAVFSSRYLSGPTLGLVLLVSGCGENRDRLVNSESSKTAPKAELFLSPMQSEGIQYVAAYGKQVRSSEDTLKRVKKVMEAYLFDPGTAQYRSLRAGRDGAVCGIFNAKNRYAAYVGFKDFVLTSDKRVVVSDTSGGIAASSNPSYVEAYLDACGTKAEIASYRSEQKPVSNIEPDTSDEPVPEQEPDDILDAPPRTDTPRSQPDIPTA